MRMWQGLFIKLLFILSIFITSTALANNPSVGFNKANNYKDKIQLGSPPASSKFLNPEGDISALQGLDDSSLSNKGNEALRSHPIGKTLQNAEERKIDATEKYKINANNPYLKNSLQIEENPLPKVSGKGLSATETISTVKIEKSCTEGVDFDVDVGFELVLNCEEVDYLGPLLPKNIDIPFIQTPRHWWLQQRYSEGNLSLRKPGAGFSFTYFTIINSMDVHSQIQAEILKRYNDDKIIINVPYQDILLHTWASPTRLTTRNIIHPNSPKKKLFHSSYRFSEAIVRFHYNTQEKLKKFVENGEYWQVVTEGTEKLADANECVETGRVCLKSGVKTFFDKYEVSRPCWYQKVSYHCRSEPKDGCAHLYRQNCQLQDSDCEYQIGGICLKWKRKFICGGKKKELHYSAVDSPIYCLGGDCHTPVIEEDNDFASVAYLAALNESSKDCVKGPNGVCKDPITVFPGQVDGCKYIIAGVINCCSSMKGWGKDANLCRCSGGEKGLAIKREKGLCHSIGTYCHQKDPAFGKCLVKKTNFCCFSSKLARIFQEQGRMQLGIGWGQPSSPNCRPLTLDELTRLDFSKFDMEELFEALLNKGKGNENKPFPHIVPGEVPAKQKEHMSTGPNKDSSNGM